MSVLYTATVLLGAFLLFLVQPMAGKRLLPALGAAPAVWNTCLLFFQAALLAGYAYAHGAAAWLPLRARLAAHAGLVLLPLAVLPLGAPAGAPPAGASPTAWLLRELSASVGLPFLALSASSPVLQGWFARTSHPRARSPWFLFAASNAGGLLALLAYPLLVEPSAPLGVQGLAWSRAYGLYAALLLLCAVHLWRAAAPAPPAAGNAPAGATPAAPAAARVALWVALAAVPSSLTLGVTAYLATDIGSLPLLWVVPLALYLLTYVVAFGPRAAVATALANRLLPILALLAAMLFVGGLGLPLGSALLLHLLLFTAAALVCHGRIAALRPAVEHLTAYYLAIAVGGALGGVANALVAPAVFDSVAEYPLAIVLACALRPASPRAGGSRGRALEALAVVAAGGLTLAIVGWAPRLVAAPRAQAALLGAPVLVAVSLARRPMPFAAALGLMLAAGALAPSRSASLLHAERTFFGVHRVSDDAGARLLMHGTTLHGTQALDPALRADPAGYYHRTGPLGEAFAGLPAASRAQVAVVGLGAGGIAAHARPGQRFTFFEIDPAVERIARRFFSYLPACGERCTVQIGDGRLSLERARPAAFDLIVLDAFSSDAIPTHLLTREAFALYVSRLAPGGALVVHHSNRHLDLEPVLGRIAHALGLSALAKGDPGGDAPGKLPSQWMVLARDARDLGPLIVQPGWRAAGQSRGAPLWTDDHSSVVGVLRLRFTRSPATTPAPVSR